MKIFKMTSVIKYFKLRLILLLLFTVHCSLFTFAQSSFTQRLQQSKNGEGKVTITQDKAIDDLVNGPKTTMVVPQTQTKSQSVTQKQTDQKTNTATTTSKPDTGTTQRPTVTALRQQPQQPDTTTVTTSDEAMIRKKVMKGGYKINGFRVQVFAGGNSRDSRIKAERVGREINSLFPGEPVYVHFYSPRWICRMGNYRTYEEASEMLRSVKKLGYNSAIIVKGKITVPYATPDEESETSNP